MSFGGHVIDMVNRTNQNRAQRPSNRSKFKENNRDQIHSEVEKKQEHPIYKTILKAELMELKTQIRNQAAIERKKEIIFYGLFIICGLVLVSLLLFWMN